MRALIPARFFLGGCALLLTSCPPNRPPVSRPETPPPVGPAFEDRQRLVELVEEVFRERYAPAELKAATLGWSREEELGSFRARVLANPSPPAAEIRRALFELVRSPSDIHTSATFEGGRAVWLGLHLKRVDGHYHVAWIDRAQLPRERVAIELGDEVIGLDGRPIEEAIVETRQATRWRSTPGFEQSFAEWFLLFRAQNEWGVIPQAGAKARLTLRRPNGQDEIELPWLDADASPPSERCPFWGKTKGGYLPPLGKVSWRSADSAVIPAYVFEGPRGPYGYVRFASYRLDPDKERAALVEMEAFAGELLRRKARGLVIDQLGNGGGNFLFGFALLSRFIDEPLRPPQQHYRVLADGHVVGIGARAGIAALLERLERVTSDQEAAALLDSDPLFQKGLAFAPRTLATTRELGAYFRFFLDRPPGLTPPHFQIQRSIEPAASGPRFTGPILLLIDELNLSAAEYVAATLVDNGRAVAFGARTSGAGGDQRWISPDAPCPQGLYSECAPPEVSSVLRELGITGLAFTTTLGVRVRADGTIGEPIENRGVSPKLEYRITLEDLRQGFEPMRARIVESLPN